MKGMTLSRAGEGVILLLVAFGVLWKGGKTLEMTWLLALAAVCISVPSLFRRLFHVRKGGGDEANHSDPHFLLWGALLLFCLWTVLSFVFSETRNYGLDEVLRAVSCILLFLWCAREAAASNESPFFRNFLSVITTVSLLACAAGFLVYCLEPVDRFVGSFFDYRFDTDFWPNAWGEYLLLAWPLVFLHSIYMRDWKYAWLFDVFLGILFGSLLLSYSRGSILAVCLQVFLIIACTTALMWRDIRYRSGITNEMRRLILRSFAAAAIGLAVFATANAVRSRSFAVQSVSEKATFTATEGKSSIDERAQFWQQALGASFERPVFGYGPYSFRFVQTKDAQGVLATSDHPHNVFLKFAMERGWPAAILFFLILVGIALPSLHKFFYERRTDWSWQNDCRSLFLGVAVAGVVAHNLIDYNLQFIGIYLPFWIVMALLYAPYASARNRKSSSFRDWKFARIGIRFELILALSLLAVASYESYFLVTSSVARHAEADGDTDTALEWYERSRGSLMGRDVLLSKAVILMDAGRSQEAGDALAEYAEQNRHDARVWKLKGILALKESDPSLAYVNIQKAFELGKMTDLGLTTLLLQAGRSAGETESLAMRKTELDELFTQFADAINQNAHFIALSRNVEELQTVSRLLGVLFPEDAKRYRDIAGKALKHAEEERSRLESRSPGMLW